MQSLPPLNALRAFEAAARRGGLKAAAEELAVTPAAVGQQVRQLEDILGAKLFERQGRTLVLTERGAAGLERLSRALDLMGEASAAMREGGEARALTLAAPRDLLCAFLAPRLARFTEAHPDIALTLLPLRGRQAAALFASGADLALVYGAEPPAGLQAERVLGESLTPAAAPDLAARFSRPGDLAGAPLIHDGSDWARASGVDWRGWLASRGAYGVDWRGGLTLGDSGAVIEATAGGFVLAFTHIFDNGDPPVEARFEIRMGFGPLFIVTAGGREIGKGHLFGDVLHYTMEFPGNTVETTCIRTAGGLRITGSASRNADGLAIAWEETLERA